MKVKSWDGNNINDGTNYVSVLPGLMGFPEGAYESASRPQAMPLLGTMNYDTLRIGLNIAIEGSSLITLRQQLMLWFDPSDNTSKQLIVTDDDGTSNERYLLCRPVSMKPARDTNRLIWRVTLEVDGAGDIDGRFRSTTKESDTWNITASGQQRNLTNNGTDRAFPRMKIKPTSAKSGSGYGYQRWIPIRWNALSPVTNYPVDIANAGLDTAALILGAKMQADGDDLRVFVDNVERDRWIGNLNTATSRVWVNLDFTEEINAVLGENIPLVGVQTTLNIKAQYPDGTPDFTFRILSKFPASGILMIDNEAFTYTGREFRQEAMLARFTGVTRAVRNTTEAAHSDGATIWLVQHDIWLVYGDSGSVAPVQDDKYKPIFNLDTSTNTSWIFGDFGDYRSYRSGGWDFSISFGTRWYSANHGGYVQPFQEMGLVNGRNSLRTRSITSRAFLRNPCGITNANFTNGEKNTDNLADWVATIEASLDGITWVEEASIAAPSLASTWQAWSANEAIGTQIDDEGTTVYPYWVSVALTSTYKEEGNEKVYIEFADCTVTLDSTYTPTVTLGGENANNYYLDCKITNNLTGESIQLNGIIKVGQEIEVDTDAKTVTLLDDGSNLFPILTVNGDFRRDWLALEPGVNQLKFEDTGTQAVTFTTDWDKRYFYV